MKPNYQNSSYNNMNNLNPNANYSRTSSLLLNLNANPYQANKPQKKMQQMQVNSPNINYNNQSNRIREVYADNFIQEIKIISKYLTQYPYVGMDTEFPGVIYPCPVASFDYYYQYTKVNVDKLKLIQLGITLTNDKGEYPSDICTWQFNLYFDCDKDEHSNDSISMLYNSGIDFKLLKNKGIPHSLFAEYLIISGLVLNEKITWICFNGSSDFAYLLKYLINDYLPEEEKDFNDLINIYFPNIYDVKYLVNLNVKQTAHFRNQAVIRFGFVRFPVDDRVSRDVHHIRKVLLGYAGLFPVFFQNRAKLQGWLLWLWC